MATRRIIHTFRDGDVKEVKEYHDGRYGAKRITKRKEEKADSGTDGDRECHE